MKNETGMRIKTLRKNKGLSAERLAKTLKLSPATIYRYENGDIEKVSWDVLIKLAKALGCTPSYLMGWEKETTIRSTDTYSFPIRGEVAAGYETLPDEAFSERIEIPEEWLRGQNPSNFFVLKVKGDSMAPDIVEDDLVLVHIQNTIDSGDIAVAIYDSEYATLKQVKYDRRDPTWLDLIPLNRSYDIKHISGEADVNQCRILGLVWRLIRDYD